MQTTTLPAAVLATILLGSTSPASAQAPAAPAERPNFARDIRPILSENCFKCHGPDGNQRQAELRLDVRDIALEKRAIVPGRPGESELVRRIFAPEKDEVMPPPESGKSLTAAQKEALRQWIAAGAEYPAHWAYIRPSRPPIPEVERRDWVRSPIDAFILRSLEARGIRPSPEADGRTLLRRLSLDLIGLPPAPGELEAFIAGSGPSAYEDQVDRLLRSPRYGERMAVPWLDVVRFSDTVGYHGDQNQNIFPYRDYVIDSFNENKPFDRFTIEQLAGDLLPGATDRELVATGFNRLNMMTREGGAQPAEYLAKYAADRVRTVGAAWLGSTLGCAECHDHKYDPFTAKDFYSLAAFFADVKQWGVYQDYGYTPNPDLKGWTNDHPFPPELEVESPYLKRRIERLEEDLREVASSAAAALEADPARRAEAEAWRRSSLAFLERHPGGWARLEPISPAADDSPEAKARRGFTPEADGRILFTAKAGAKAEKAEVSFRLPPPRAAPSGGGQGGELPSKGVMDAGRLAAIQVELLPHERHGGKVARGGGQSAAVALSASLKQAGGETRLEIFHAEADRKEERFANGRAILGVKDVWKTSIEQGDCPQRAVWILEKPQPAGEGDVLTLTFGGAVGCARVSVSPFAAKYPLQSGGGEALFAALRKAPGERTAPERILADETWLLSAGSDPGALARARKIIRDLLECRGGRAPTMITVASEPRRTRVLPRGNWQDESGAEVEPAVPAFLPGPRGESGGRLTRLDLARWIVSRENPLTARAVVNRLWKQFFGTAISAVVDDLGAQGEWPVHPELLDWLAVELMESGWDLKHMVRLIVTSSTYRQHSSPWPELIDIDPSNRLLASQSPRRLDAEFVRDNALSIAGLLDGEMGGPSAFPYQPAGYYVNLQFPDRDYVPDVGERQYRRGVYTHWQRTFLHPMLANFDAPSREECTASRTLSNTPQQALTLLNDPTFLEAARAFAERLLASGRETDDGKLDAAFETALSRSCKEPERASLARLLASQREHIGLHPEDAKAARAGSPGPAGGRDEAELAAWTSVCRVILNLHETITRY